MRALTLTALSFTALSPACQAPKDPNSSIDARDQGADDAEARLALDSSRWLDLGEQDTSGSDARPDMTRAVDARFDVPDLMDLSESIDLDASQDSADMVTTLNPPAALQRWIVGREADAAVTPLGPGLILMGGGPDVDEAFLWWRPKIAGGDVVVLRASGSNGYNDYLYTEIGGADSVETLVVDTRALAEDRWVAERVEQAEGIFIAGGDQAVYLSAWRGTALQAALTRAWNRGAVIGGTSAGCAILGDFIFSAARSTIHSDEALADPFDPRLTLESEFLATSLIPGLITDTHFYARDRMGRLVAFVSRLRHDGESASPLGVGIDEATALVIDASGEAEVLGSDYVYVLDGSRPPLVCEAGLPLKTDVMPYTRLAPGDRFTPLTGQGLIFDRTLRATAGALEAEDLY